jgi:AAA domain
MARMSSEARARLEAFKAVKVKHPRLEESDRRITQAIEEHAGYSHLWVYGPTGVGKSTVTQYVTSRFVSEEPNRAVVPVVWVEARPSDTGMYTRLDYYSQVLSRLREHAAVKDRLMNLALGARPSQKTVNAVEWLEMREAVEYTLARLQVKAVVIDEAQHLLQVSAPLRPMDQLNWLNSLTNHTQVLHVLVGPYDLYDVRNLFGQAARRGRDVHFPRYHLERKEERMEFVGALRYLLEHVPLTCDVDQLLSQWRWFAEWSVGCVGILRDWVVDTVAMLLIEGGTTLTREALQACALEVGQRVRLEMEARTGERKVEDGQAHNQQQLQALLGKPARGQKGASNASPSSEASQEPLPNPQRSLGHQLSTGRQRVERAPSRDPVGTGLMEAPANKCSFLGILDLLPQAMQAAGVSKVECPVCATTRSLNFRGKTVRFPPHDKRKTRSPHREIRWVKNEATWELAGP